jgi:hypothetical protein
VEFLGLRMGEADTLRAGNDPGAKYNRILARAWEYEPSGTYSFYSYQKPELVLRTLEGYLGRDMMARVMRTYHERWRFRHPDSNDFFAVVNEVSGRDLSWYFDAVVRGTDTLDFDIGTATTRQVPEAQGVFDTASGRKTVSEKDALAKEDDLDKAKKRTWETKVTVRRKGEAVFPVDVDFKFEGKPIERQTWDGRDRRKTFTFVRPEKLEWVEVDRDRKVELDANWVNNGRRLTPDSRVSTTWASRWLFVAQNVIFWLGF